MDLKSMLAAAQRRVVREVFGTGEHAFEVELQLCSRSDLERMRKAAVVKVLDRKTRQYRDEPDVYALRTYLQEHCISDWSGLTFGMAATLCNRTLPTDMAKQFGATAVPYDPENVRMMLEEALGFEDWVWEHATNLAEADEERTLGEKPSSATISEATSAS